jgi:pimeloyl-ACP methyl ester carboxylesterase
MKARKGGALRRFLTMAAIPAALGAVWCAPAGAASFAPVNQPGPALTVPADQLAASLKCTPNVQSATSEPVLLESATGVNSDDNYSWNYERAFNQLGIPYCTTDQPGPDASNLGDIQVRGQYIVYAMRQMYALSGRRIAVMGHSQGGMVMRWALRFWPDTRALVEDVVGMAGSNHGTNVSQTCPCQPANWQQGDQADFIKALNSGQETFAGTDYTEIYTQNDEVVRPNSDSTGSSSVHGPGQITNVAVQDICPNDPSEHLAIGTQDPVAYALFLDALNHGGPADPSRIDPSVCSQTFMPGINPMTYPQDAGTAAAALETNENTYPKVDKEPPLACYTTASCPGVPRCTSSRRIKLNLDRLFGTKLRKAKVKLAGKRVKVIRRKGRLIAIVDLRKHPGETLTLRARARTSKGKVVKRSKRYVVCAA